MTLYYSDEFVTLHHGDCTQVTDWLTADVLVTDPPYGMDYQSGAQRSNPAARAEIPRERVSGDQSTESRDAVMRMWGTRPAIVFGIWRLPRPDGTRHRLIWHKAQKWPGLSTAPFYPTDEEVYIIGSGWDGKPLGSVITTNEARSGAHSLTGRLGHPTPKPGELMEQLIVKCPPGVIADPFAGSGSTLVAARNLGRQAIGVEIEERYCELIANRLAQDVLPL